MLDTKERMDVNVFYKGLTDIRIRQGNEILFHTYVHVIPVSKVDFFTAEEVTKENITQ